MPPSHLVPLASNKQRGSKNNNNVTVPVRCGKKVHYFVVLTLVLVFASLQMVHYNHFQKHVAVVSTLSSSSTTSVMDKKKQEYYDKSAGGGSTLRQLSLTSRNDKNNNSTTNVAMKTTAQQKQPPQQFPFFSQLPLWIQNYVTWHQQMRAKFPGHLLFEHPDAPKILIRYGPVGGLHDRLGQLPWDLYLANQTNRLLLIHWHRPRKLQDFLLPPLLGIDWRVPDTDRTPRGFFRRSDDPPSLSGKRFIDHFTSNLTKEMFFGFDSGRPDDKFWNVDFPVAMERAKSGNYSSFPILRERLLGHLFEDILEDRLRALGETDMIHKTPTFGHIFRLFFVLAPPIQERVDKIYRDLHLTPGNYSVVHCRVRHPKSQKGLIPGKHGGKVSADVAGLLWDGETRLNAIQIANRALECAQTLQQPDTDGNEPVYFMSDSNDLVHFMSLEVKKPRLVRKHNSTVERHAQTITRTMNVVARPANEVNAHIDKQMGRDASFLYGAFIDLFVAIHARCVTYGVGFYASFAAKISHTPCRLLHRREAWGAIEPKNGSTAPLCHLESD